MALSLLNYFWWKNEEARLPFVLADIVFIVGLHFVERGLKAEKRLAEIEQEKQDALHEQDKKQHKARDKQARDAQRREQKVNIPVKGTSAFGNTHTIQQPKKSN